MPTKAEYEAKLHLTPRQAAEALGVHISSVYGFERNHDVEFNRTSMAKEVRRVARENPGLPIEIIANMAGANVKYAAEVVRSMRFVERDLLEALEGSPSASEWLVDTQPAGVGLMEHAASIIIDAYLDEALREAGA